MASIDLNEIVNRELEAALQPELLQAAVKKQFDGLVQRAVEAAFAGWRDGPGKALTLKIEQAIGVQVAAVDLTSATLGLTEIVSAEVGRLLQEMAVPVVQQRLTGLLKSAPASMELSDLIEAYRAWAQEQAYLRDDAKAISLIMRESDHSKGWVDVYLHPAERLSANGYARAAEAVKWHQCDICIRLKPDVDGGPLKIWALGVRELELSSDGKLRTLGLTEWEINVYKMFIAGTTFGWPSVDATDYHTAFDVECDCG